MNDAITRLPGSDFDQRWKDVAHRWARHADHVRLAQVREEETVQIGRGNCEWQSVWAYGLDTLLTHAACSVAVSARVVPHPDWIAILAPTHVTSVLRINGCEVGPEDIYLSTTANGHCITGQRRSGFALGLRRARLAGACAALAGIAEDDLVIRDLEMSLGRDGAAHLHALFWAAISDALTRPISEGWYALSSVWEKAILAHMAGLLSPVLSTRSANRFPGLNALRAVRAAEAACADLAHPPTLPELCAAAGVGERWLRKCFIDVHGTPPAQYFLKRRLSAAHDRFLDPGARKHSVKDVALSLGFFESGRFAQYYRDLFCEYPLDTLARAENDPSTLVSR